MAPLAFKPLLAALLLAAAPTNLFGQTVAQHETKARAGDIKAMAALGKAYEEGAGVAKNYADAARWYRAAADKGSAEGMEALARLYDGGLGVSKDYAEALSWHRAAAKKGDGRAMWGVGMHYVAGQGVPKNPVEAVKWFRLSAAKGDERGLNSLGVMYKNGEGVPQNYREALRILRLAADKGNSTAITNLAGMYRDGQGVPKDGAEADRLAAAAKSADPKKWRTFVASVPAPPPLQPAGLAPARAAPAPRPTVRYPWIVNQSSATVTLYQDGQELCVMEPDEDCGEVRVRLDVAAQFRAVSSRGGEASFYRQYGRDVPIHICIRDGPQIVEC